MDPSDPPLTLREKTEANQARAHLLREERMLRKEQKPFLVRYLPEFLCWAAALSALYVCGAWTFKPIREHNETSREAYKSGTNPYYTASALYAAVDIDAAAETLDSQRRSAGCRLDQTRQINRFPANDWQACRHEYRASVAGRHDGACAAIGRNEFVPCKSFKACQRPYELEIGCLHHARFQ